MQFEHWLGIGIAALVVFGVITNFLKRPKPIGWAEVPLEIRTAFESTLRGFIIKEVLHHAAEREYMIKGSYRGRDGKAEIDMDRSGGISDIEYDDLAAGSVRKIGLCEISSVPAEVIAHMDELLGDEKSSFQLKRVFNASCNGEAAYDIKGYTANWEWEFEFLESGVLLDLEKEVIRQRF